jgi:hypothetical protein
MLDGAMGDAQLVEAGEELLRIEHRATSIGVKGVS